jgi:hypothetical protein
MTVGELVPIISAVGFAVQQLLQIADPIVSAIIGALRNQFSKNQADGTGSSPSRVSDVDLKKSIMGLLSLLAGVVVVSVADEIRVLHVMGADNHDYLDWFISALTISAGSEGANSILKLAQYLKDMVKGRTSNAPPPPLNIGPSLDPLHFGPTPNPREAALAANKSSVSLPPTESLVAP